MTSAAGAYIVTFHKVTQVSFHAVSAGNVNLIFLLTMDKSQNGALMCVFCGKCQQVNITAGNDMCICLLHTTYLTLLITVIVHVHSSRTKQNYLIQQFNNIIFQPTIYDVWFHM